GRPAMAGPPPGAGRPATFAAPPVNRLPSAGPRITTPPVAAQPPVMTPRTNGARGGMNPNAGGAARQGPVRANEQGVTNSNPNARLRGGAATDTRVRTPNTRDVTAPLLQDGEQSSNRRVNRQGPANASDRGVERSNENAGLRTGSTDGGRGGTGGTDLTGLLRNGLQLRDASGAVVGTVTGVTRNADGTITAVTVRLADGSTRTVNVSDIQVTDGTATLNLSQIGNPPVGAEGLAARLQRGAEVFDPSGKLVGRIERLVTSGDGNVRAVVVQVRNGARRFLGTVPIEGVTLGADGQIIVRVSPG
ncbi:MAG: hypothetical protein M3M95_04930, partial [Pseudomonadota bacterium]|nr:hypothetical protein [Pseudomonadota bacterium]